MMLVFIGLAVLVLLLYMYSDSVTIVLRTVTLQVPSNHCGNVKLLPDYSVYLA